MPVDTRHKIEEKEERAFCSVFSSTTGAKGLWNAWVINSIHLWLGIHMGHTETEREREQG